MNIDIQNKVYLCCPEKKILFYLNFAGYVFKIKELTFSKDLKNLSCNNISIILDQSLIYQFLKREFKNNNQKIYIFFSDGYIDYLKYQEQILELQKKGFQISIVTQENWHYFKNFEHYSLTDLKISKKNSLKKIRDIGIFNKIKFYYPIFTSISNAIKNFNLSIQFLIKPRVVYVGRASYKETIDSLKNLLETKIISEHLQTKIISNLNQVKIKELFKIIDDQEFKKLEFVYQYRIYNIIIRFLIISHFVNFKIFYHKTNKKFNFELLNTNIYKKIFHIDLGVTPGNSFVGDRTIYLERFYDSRFFKIKLFDEKINYKQDNNFCNRLKVIQNFIEKIYENKDFDSNFIKFKNWIIKVSKSFL